MTENKFIELNDQLKNVYFKRWMNQVGSVGTAKKVLYPLNKILVLKCAGSINNRNFFKSFLPSHRQHLLLTNFILDVNNVNSVINCLAHEIVELDLINTIKVSGIEGLNNFLDKEEDIIEDKIEPRLTVFAATVSESKFLPYNQDTSRFLCLDFQTDDLMEEEEEEEEDVIGMELGIATAQMWQYGFRIINNSDLTSNLTLEEKEMQKQLNQHFTLPV